MVRLAVIVGCVAFLSAAARAAGTYHVAPGGDDARGDGSAGRPWRTIRKASDSVPDDGSEIVLADGTYVGAQSVARHFTKRCTIRAARPYRARLRSPDSSTRAFHCYGGSGFVLEGLELFGSGSMGGEFLVHVSNESAHHVTFRDCMIHDSYNNDLIKINSRAHHITFTGCLFANAANNQDNYGNEHFDINVATDVVLEDSVFLNDFEGSGRRTLNDTHPFVLVKNSGDSSPDFTRRIAIRRNVFLNWSGHADQSFVLLGEDGKPFMEAQDVTVENNLFLMNSPHPIVGALMLKGGLRNVTFRSNTVSGHPEGGSAYAVRTVREGRNPPMEDVRFFGNIWSDPRGMVDFSDGRRTDVKGELALVGNLYWSAGRAIPADREWTLLDPDAPANDDPRRVVADPGLKDPAGLGIPRWDAARGRFASGSRTIREEFERLVRGYAAVPAGSPAVDRADPANSPPDDILGNARGARPDIGCFELGARPAAAGARRDRPGSRRR